MVALCRRPGTSRARVVERRRAGCDRSGVFGRAHLPTGRSRSRGAGGNHQGTYPYRAGAHAGSATRRGNRGPMAGELSRHDLDSLLGAHALDAVDPGEREQIDRYLAENPSARAEIDETREVMSLLVEPEEGSPALWTRIQEEISRPPEATKVHRLTASPRARRPPFTRRAIALVAAAA